jgi:hypothetical protein
MPRVTATVTAQNTWTSTLSLLAPNESLRDELVTVPLLLSGTWAGSQVSVQVWDAANGETAADAASFAKLQPSDGGVHFLTTHRRFGVRAGVATGDYAAGDSVSIRLG